jgi:hypothetical protein
MTVLNDIGDLSLLPILARADEVSLVQETNFVPGTFVHRRPLPRAGSKELSQSI